MGVRGLSSLLRGIINDDDGGGEGLAGGVVFDSYNDASSSSSDALTTAPTTTMAPLPRGSTLAVDGDGLAFHLHRLAYGSHFGQRSVGIGSTSIRSSSIVGGGIEERGGGTSVDRCLPHVVPYRMLSDATDEFVRNLVDRCGLHLVVYFDGNGGGGVVDSKVLGSTALPSVNEEDDTVADDGGGEEDMYEEDGIDDAAGERVEEGERLLGRFADAGDDAEEEDSEGVAFSAAAFVATDASAAAAEATPSPPTSAPTTNASAAAAKSRKRHETSRRRSSRQQSWDNLRRYCDTGALPSGCRFPPSSNTTAATPSRIRTSRRQRRTPSSSGGKGRRRSGNGNDDDEPMEEAWLRSFPMSKLSSIQIKCALRRWSKTRARSTSRRFVAGAAAAGGGSVTLMQCLGEADVDAAFSSASDPDGITFVLGQDSDYLVYGFAHDARGGGGGSMGGEVKYVPMDTLRISDSNNNSDDGVAYGMVYTRSSVAASLGLPDSDSVVELALVLGNDVTGPYLRQYGANNGKLTSMSRRYRRTVRWSKIKRTGDGNGTNGGRGAEKKIVLWDDGEGGDGPPLPMEEDEDKDDDLIVGVTTNDDNGDDDDVEEVWDDSDWRDIHSIVHRVSSMDAGMRASSTSPDLDDAMRFSRAMYGFQDVSTFGEAPPQSSSSAAVAAVDDTATSDAAAVDDGAEVGVGVHGSSANNGLILEEGTREEGGGEQPRIAEGVETGLADVPPRCGSMPTLPLGLDLGAVADATEEFEPRNVRDAALRPLERLVAEGSSTEDDDDAVAIEPRHVEAFRMVLDRLQMSSIEVDGDGRTEDWTVCRRRMRWEDVRVAYVIERCVASAIEHAICAADEERAGGNYHDDLENTEPFRLFDHGLFHAALEGMANDAVGDGDDRLGSSSSGGDDVSNSAYDDMLRLLGYEGFPLENSAVSKKERSFAEEMTTHVPASLASATATPPYASRAEIASDEAAVAMPPRQRLPIDDHEDGILDAIRSQRVTIIHGETGCGKSSRVPVMLMRAAPEVAGTNVPAKMFVSQPRRIAAKSLTDRVRSCEPDLRDEIALRLGHGVREYETSSTRAWFVTTGYLVRLLANHPQTFDSHTHLIIDEVHERSVDNDILCLLCRRLLLSHPTIRLVLMSATMAASLYSSYFCSPEPPIYVGARRFPIQEYYAEDLDAVLHLPPREAGLAAEVYKTCEQLRCSSAPNNSHMDKLYQLATQITLSVGQHGSSVLIFVPGMADIVSITERIEDLNVPGVHFSCLPIHGDVPFEEQMLAFEPDPFAVKVIIATNAAESSVTLPDVDHVVCLGLCKQIVYNSASHRQMLEPCWISKASATQRAGRTGRVREGCIYRLYSRSTYDTWMEEYDKGEMLRIPLDNVILSLRDMLSEEVTPVLLECIEPPNISTIERSFQSLHQSNFISEPNDSGKVTSLGALVVALGIDLTLGALVGLGIQFGVPAEAIQMAAVLSFPKSPWLITNPLYHEADQYNDITAKTFVSRSHFDANLYSEPLAVMNLLWDFEQAQKKDQFCRYHSVSAPRLRRLSATVKSLRNRVTERLNVARDELNLEQPPVLMLHAKVTILRVLQVWLFSDTMISSSPEKELLPSDEVVSMKLIGAAIDDRHLQQILRRDRHPYTLKGQKKIYQTGTFTPIESDEFDWVDFFANFEIRFISYAICNDFDLFWYHSGSSLHLFDGSGLLHESEHLQRLLGSFVDCSNGETLRFQRIDAGNRRGRRGRACGSWSKASAPSCGGEKDERMLMRFSCRIEKKKAKEMQKKLDGFVLDCVEKYMFCSVDTDFKKENACITNFSIVMGGCCDKMTKVDLSDLFATPHVNDSVMTRAQHQVLSFASRPNAPLDPFGEKIDDNIREDSQGKVAVTVDGQLENTSWHRPLLKDIPEGARLMAVLASGRRKDHFIRFSDVSNDVEEKSFLDVTVPVKTTKISRRWRKKDDGGSVFVAENNICAAAISTEGPIELFACCANTLELRGGAVRVEGMTLLPPGRLFIALASLTFGLTPFPSKIFEENLCRPDSEEEDDAALLLKKDTLAWIRKQDGEFENEDEVSKRIALAIAFNASCRNLGEELTCHPEKVLKLCEIFQLEPWENLADDPLIKESSDGMNRDRTKLWRCPVEEKKESETKSRTLVRYRCLSCEIECRKWKECRKHMESCCPELLKSQSVSRRTCSVCVPG